MSALARNFAESTLFRLTACLAANSFFACAIESCTKAARCSSAEGWLYQLNPMRTTAISKNPMMLFLSIISFYFLLLS